VDHRSTTMGKKNPPAFEREEDVAFYPGLKMKKI
jgi:hypothetical protein